ncbi:solute carrier family 23 protein [Paraclostridium bifermentans]|uniref:solute carrier family 23 protein n=1 Tax=Paraclostridium bifermentans TaxID=1490 RepID=UPI00242DE78A|nr:solute carrier family 23 protein [Paraclostridium bifermentans]
MSQEKSPKIAPVDERIPVSKSWIFSLQHVLAMCAGAVAVPMMVGSAAGLDHESIVFLINSLC